MEQRRDNYDLAKLSQSVDFINLMTNSLVGNWENRTGFGNALKSGYQNCLNLVSNIFCVHIVKW